MPYFNAQALPFKMLIEINGLDYWTVDYQTRDFYEIPFL